jgi:16S rRNA (uracil1498-N3)-methyltransferase
MPDHDFRTPRMFVAKPLHHGHTLPLERDQANYLSNVLRLAHADSVLVFNGADGEFLATLDVSGKRNIGLHVQRQVREQSSPADLWYCFAPLKATRLDYVVQKAVEMGVSQLRPIMTHHTQVTRVNLDRMRANVIEAAEQCGILSVPDVMEPVRLDRLVATWPTNRHLVFCDERAPISNPVSALSTLPRGTPTAVIIGPEGGFDDQERDMIGRIEGAVRLSLGPRILRADTAAVAALTAVQCAMGDWV